MLDDFGVRRTAGETATQALDGIWLGCALTASR